MDTGLNNVQATNNLCCLATSQPVKEFIDIRLGLAEI
jgi:hypothetical protein